jgi:superfamily I DNA and RNA helicase
VVYFRQLLGLIKLKNKMGKGSKESDEQSIVEATRNSQDVLEMNKHQFKQTLAQVNSRLRRIVKDNPMLEVELKGTMSLLRMCSVRDELGFVPAGHRLIELRDTQNLINFDSRLSF